jgi:hypothetical protein
MSMDVVRSRRAVLVGALGATAAAAATVVADQRVFAAGDDGAVLHVADDLEDVQSQTLLINKTNNETLLSLRSTTTAGGGGSRVVECISDSGQSVYGSSTHGIGVVGISGSTQTGAVLGFSVPGTGVQGVSSSNQDSIPVPPPHTGVFGICMEGRGAQFKGKAAQVRLQPSSSATHPKHGQRGDLFVDNFGRLWFCKGDTVWKQLA